MPFLSAWPQLQAFGAKLSSMFVGGKKTLKGSGGQGQWAFERGGRLWGSDNLFVTDNRMTQGQHGLYVEL